MLVARQLLRRDAFAEAEEVLAPLTDDPDWTRASAAWSWIGVARLARKDRDGARAAAREALAIDPGQPGRREAPVSSSPQRRSLSGGSAEEPSAEEEERRAGEEDDDAGDDADHHPDRHVRTGDVDAIVVVVAVDALLLPARRRARRRARGALRDARVGGMSAPTLTAGIGLVFSSSDSSARTYLRYLSGSRLRRRAA